MNSLKAQPRSLPDAWLAIKSEVSAARHCQAAVHNYTFKIVWSEIALPGKHIRQSLTPLLHVNIIRRPWLAYLQGILDLCFVSQVSKQCCTWPNATNRVRPGKQRVTLYSPSIPPMLLKCSLAVVVFFLTPVSFLIVLRQLFFAMFIFLLFYCFSVLYGVLKIFF